MHQRAAVNFLSEKIFNEKIVFKDSVIRVARKYSRFRKETNPPHRSFLFPSNGLAQSNLLAFRKREFEKLYAAPSFVLELIFMPRKLVFGQYIRFAHVLAL